MKYITGDLIEMAKGGQFDIIVHGCNCFNTMGSGIALQIRKQFPSAYWVDQSTLKGSEKKLGHITMALIDKDLIVINAYTQFSHNFKGCPCDYNAIRNSFQKIVDIFGKKKLRIGIPKIGAGLAGGDWDKIEKIIDDVTLGVDVTCVLWDKT